MSSSTELSISPFAKFTSQLQAEFQKGKSDQVAQETRTVRVGAVAVGILAAVGALIATSLAVGFLPATYGFSSFLFIPAAALFVVAFDSYKVVRCCDIVVDRAEAQQGPVSTAVQNGVDRLSETPAWIKRLQEEVNSALILNFLANNRW